MKLFDYNTYNISKKQKKKKNRNNNNIFQIMDK